MHFGLAVSLAVAVIGGRSAKRLGQSPANLPGRRVWGALELRQDHLHHAFEDAWVAPKHMKGLIEHLALVAAVDEHRMQRPIEVVAAAQPNGLGGANGVDGFAGADRQTSGPQDPREMQHIFGQATSARAADSWLGRYRRGIGQRHRPRPPGRFGCVRGGHFGAQLS